jgi:hypothetical protein
MRDPRNTIDSYRNPLKRSYAADYYHHLRNGGPEPERPEGLSYMAAQAVQMQIGADFRALLGVGDA